MIEFTPEQKTQMADQILKAISQGNEREILRGLETMGYKPPQQVQQELADYDRQIAAGQNPAEAAHFAQLEHERQQNEAYARQQQEEANRQAYMRQQQGNQMNNPNKVFLDDMRKQQEELKKLKEDVIKERTHLREQLAKVETSVMADKFTTSLSNELSKTRADYPALKGVSDTELLTMVKQAKQDHYAETKELVSTKDVLRELNNQWANQINNFIEDKEKHLKIFKDEADKQIIKDEQGNVVGELNDKGVLVKTLTKDATAGDKVSAPKPTPGKKFFNHADVEKTKEDGTIVVDSEDIDPDKLVQAASQARDQGPSLDTEGTSKVEAVLKQAYERGDDDGGQGNTNAETQSEPATAA